MFKQVQRQTFSEQMNTFKKMETFNSDISQRRINNQVKKWSSLYNLEPFLIDEFIRIGERLQRASIPEDSKHQIILPKKNALQILS
jgi:hypothetical protein